MKADERRTPAHAKHQLDHELPTVIHHPEEELPLLARWLDRAMQNQTRFWSLIAAIVLVTVGLSLLGSGLTLGRATSDQAWTKLENAKTPAERVEIAKNYPKTAAERWALLQAATEYYLQGFNDLPSHRDAALPNLKLALTLFQRVADESEPNSPQARAAALGVARTLEARNDRLKAIAQYERVAGNKAWAGTIEAREADRLARLLKSPEAEAFYKDLYAFNPPAATLPPGGVGGLDLPLPSGHPPVNFPGMPGGIIPGLGPVDLPLPSSGRATEPNPSALPPPPPGPSDSLPADPFAPKAETPKPTSGLPDDVFTPGAKTGSPK